MRAIVLVLTASLLACDPGEDPPPIYPEAAVTLSAGNPVCEGGGYRDLVPGQYFTCIWDCCWYEGQLLDSLILHYTWQSGAWHLTWVEAGSGTCPQ